VQARRPDQHLPADVPEAAIAMLACARIGAAHSVVFGGFSAQSLSDRINDAEAKVLDHRRRRLPPRRVFPLKPAPTRRLRRRRRSSTSSSCVAAATTSTMRTGAITGTTT
jgi:acyl-coenzyme A synthetase/AMP-(fatty) acid ligase